MLIHEKILAVMADSSAIAKDRKNDQQGYKFRGIDDVYASLHPILAKHGVFAYPEVVADKHEERQTKSGSNLIYRVLTIKYHFCASDGSEIVACVIGEGMDSGDKASNRDKLTAAQVVMKYSIGQSEGADAKEPHEMTPEEIQQRIDALRRAAADKARPVIEGKAKPQDTGVFD